MHAKVNLPPDYLSYFSRYVLVGLQGGHHLSHSIDTLYKIRR